jgi:hypothetical protein
MVGPECVFDGEYPARGDTVEEETLRKRMPEIVRFADMISTKFAAMLRPGEYLVVDESMVLWRGSGEMVQLLPGKPIPVGYKLFTLCTAEGYVLSFLIYAGSPGDKALSERSTELAVLKLVAPYANSDGAPWRTVIMDRFYSAIPLFLELYERKLLALGSIVTNRKGYPDFGKLKKDSFVSAQLKSHRHLTAVAWRGADGDVRHYLSTATEVPVPAALKRTSKTGRIVKLPSVAKVYHKQMCGVDRANRTVADIDAWRKSQRRWFPLFLEFFAMAVSNAYYLYKRYRDPDRTVSYDGISAFCEALLEELTNGFEDGRSNNASVQSVRSKHTPAKIFSDSTGKTPRLKCRVVSDCQGDGKMKACGKQGQWYCAECSSDTHLFGVCFWRDSDNACWQAHVSSTHQPSA